MTRYISLWRWVRAGKAAAVHRGQLPREVMAEVGVWTCRQASRAATLSWMWGWRTSVAGKSARTHFCLSSPLCPQGSSLSWICLPLQACTGFRTHTNSPAWCSGMMLTHLHRWKSRFKSLLPVRIKGASVSRQAHVVLHLQRSVLLLLTNVISFQLVLGLHNAPQHLTVGESIVWSHCFIKATASQRHEFEMSDSPFAGLLCLLTSGSHSAWTLPPE